MKTWVVLLLIFVLAEAALLSRDAALDTYLWRLTRWTMGSQDAYQWPQYRATSATSDTPWYKTGNPPIHGTLYKKTEKLWRIFRDLGEPQMLVILLLVVALYDQRKWRAAAILGAAALLAGGAGMLLRAATGRLRPDGVLLDESLTQLHDSAGNLLRNEGGNYWYFFRGFDCHFAASDLAFPSGHATLAFAIAAVLAYFSPRGRGLFFVLAALCAIARVVMQAHFYSDALMGAAVGMAIGHASAVLLDRLDARSTGEKTTLPPRATA